MKLLNSSKGFTLIKEKGKCEYPLYRLFMTFDFYGQSNIMQCIMLFKYNFLQIINDNMVKFVKMF